MKNPFLKLMLVTNKGDRSLHDYLTFIKDCAEAGITSVQLREKNLSHEDSLIFGKSLQRILNPLDIPLIINDNIALALELDADGVHLGQKDGDIKLARILCGNSKIIGITINSLDQLYAANLLPVDYVGVGAIFPTKNKTNIETLWGCDRLKQLSLISTHSIIAIGGINEFNIHEVMDAGAYGVAAIGAFHDTKDGVNITRKLRNIIDSYQGSCTIK